MSERAGPEIAVRILVSGRVQGVWFRGWTVEAANARGVRGWVRNRRDGRVEALLIGPENAVKAVVAACHQGPPAARVENVEQIAAADDGSTGFRQMPTV